MAESGRVHHRLPAVVQHREGLEFSDRQSALGFGAEAEVAGRDVAADVSRHIGPPMVARDQFQSLEPTGMASHLGIMAEGDDAASKVRAVWDVDATAKIQEAVPIGPFPRTQGSVGCLPELPRSFGDGFVCRSANSLADVVQYIQLRSSELKAFKSACRED